MTERDASHYVPRSLVHQLSEAHAEIERLRAALESIALLDEADGHELKERHAFLAVAIATRTLGKHPSEILAGRLRAYEQKADSSVMRQARMAADEVATWSRAKQDHARRVMNQGAYGQSTKEGE